MNTGGASASLGDRPSANTYQIRKKQEAFGQVFAEAYVGEPRVMTGFWKTVIRAAREGVHMLKVLILICSASIDTSACDQQTATDVITAARVGTPQQCGFQGQALMAPTSLVPDPGKQYMKIMCVRDQVASAH